ncbi:MULTISPECIES: hypothetical protein [Rhizobium]|uniref:DUF3052 domain-containing protein n=1 Tax=Rhizobium favelukesii TaxID=348824 RepID=W6RCH4_9HYPH|nr:MULTISPECIES: hypothetical protein [Rhizobium]MCS0457607.1 DUF3052 domain-containing protein [Rhizobium favelukesii]UFS83825.1 DUF3052 domain-containing protein [Rhizobium sp. T136]CDM58549.1 hypothetical protein LPU83_2898 [Rhizobium favelukesii]
MTTKAGSLPLEREEKAPLAPAGYSGSSLTRKLGLKEGRAALLVGVPDIAELRGFHFSSVDTAVPAVIERRFDYVHVFETRLPRLEDMAQSLSGVLRPDGMLWISWPKKAARMPTTITEDVLRSIFLPLGLVDVKVCAIDETWSGLKFMIRKELGAGL